MGSDKKQKTVEYGRYGYIFIAPFFIVYFAFQLYPLLSTFYYSLFTYIERNRQTTIEFGGLSNFETILGLGGAASAPAIKYFGNTVIMWLGNFIPQILLSLLLAAWLTNNKVKLKGAGAYKVLVYLPNVITAASISVLFKAMFSPEGPITLLLRDWGIIEANYDFMKSTMGTRGLISFILFWMWYGNTTILLISGVMGISPSLFEAADIDGANGRQKFFKITLPLLKPILMYVLITSLIGGFQMYDIPALFNVQPTGYYGNPDDKSTTVTMFIMRLYHSDPGQAAAISVLLFIVTVVASVIYFKVLGDKKDKGGR